jgi:hypothetical protein
MRGLGAPVIQGSHPKLRIRDTNHTLALIVREERLQDPS